MVPGNVLRLASEGCDITTSEGGSAEPVKNTQNILANDQHLPTSINVLILIEDGMHTGVVN
jgi:hypothetical protein